MSVYLYSAFLLNLAQSTQVMLRAYWDHTVLPATHTFIPARAEQDLEHNIRNELLNVAAHFTDLGRMEV